MELPSHGNVFAISHGGGYLVYAPLAGRVVHVNSACGARLKDYLVRRDPEVLGERLVRELGGLDWLSPRPEPVALPVDRHFHPTAVTLFLTTRCDLRCTYCYASAGETGAGEMPAAVSRAAIDIVVRNARRAGRAPAVGFHGGGEPTMAWEALVGAIDHARAESERVCRKPVNLGIATNGVMRPEYAAYLATTFPVVTLSCDGPPDIQNVQRPLPDGTGSFDRVMAFVEVLRAHRTPLVIRSTITERNVSRQPELVDFLVDRTGCEQLHFEPVFASGRRLAAEGAPLAPMDFAKGFVAALERARARGVRLRYSAARVSGAFLSFCGCAQDGFNVTPTGDVSACFEVCDAGDPRAEVFYYGRIDPAAGGLTIDDARLARLRGLVVHNKAACDSCFARWSCSGDCPVKAGPDPLAFEREGPRCEMNRSITKALLVQALEHPVREAPAGPGPSPHRETGRVPYPEVSRASGVSCDGPMCFQRDAASEEVSS